jgi:hypothetical protein
VHDGIDGHGQQAFCKPSEFANRDSGEGSIFGVKVEETCGKPHISAEADDLRWSGARNEVDEWFEGAVDLSGEQGFGVASGGFGLEEELLESE